MTLLQHLRAPVDPLIWAQSQQQLQAKSYLDSQTANGSAQQLRQWLNNSLTDQPSDFTHWQYFQQQLLSRTQLTISLLSPQPQALFEPLSQALNQLPQTADWPHSTATKLPPQHQLRTGLADYQLWIGRQTIGRNHQGFAPLQLAVRQLQDLAATLNIHSSWRPGANDSQLLLNANAASAIDLQMLLSGIDQQLQTSEDEHLDGIRQQMIDSLYQISQNSVLFFEQLETIAFYRHPPDYLQQFLDSVEQQTIEQQRQQIKALLDSRQYHWVLQTPAS